MNLIFCDGIFGVIVSVTKFSIVIGHPRAFFLRNWRAVTWVSNYSYPVTTFCNWIAAIGHLRCARVNQLHFLCCFPPDFKRVENILDVLSKKESTWTFHSQFCY